MLGRTDEHPAERAALLDLPHRVGLVQRRRLILQEGERSDDFHILLSGMAYHQKVTRAGAKQILSIRLRGDILNLFDYLEDRSSHDIVAVTRVGVAAIPKSALKAVASRHCVLSDALERDMRADAASWREWLVILGRRNARQRAAHLLCELALRQRASGVWDWRRFDAFLTVEDVANSIGVTPVHVSRTMKSMRQEGLITGHGRSLQILDWPGLQEAGDFNGDYLHLPDFPTEPNSSA